MQIPASQKVLFIVESPAKCKTIAGYLPKNFEVIATYGHIKSLKKEDGSVLPEENFKMTWESNNPARIKEIVGKAEKVSKEDGIIIIATDPDREGEAIAYHVYSAIKPKIKCEVKRAIYNEISRNKILEAIEQAGEIDQDKVDSYFARNALDYLIGFNLSPMLWRKLKCCKSAGRVQSAAMRAIIDRETEIINFKPQKYWTLTAMFDIDKVIFKADLYQWMGKPLEKFMWTGETVKTAAEKLKGDFYKVGEIEKKEIKKSPYPPFTTSTMQQEASSKYGWSPSKTSSVAQTLYEGVSIGGKSIGLVTYIRTDSVRIADDALIACKSMITEEYGKKYSELRKYANKSKAAQDGHEAIRPANFNLLPWQMEIEKDHKMLYELIWRRAVASQMSPAVYNVTNVYIEGDCGTWKLHGRERIFDGFLAAYKHEDSEEENIGSIDKKASPEISDISVNEHSTQPKPQYTEASLIKHMDEVGIGRPSTYAHTLKILETREYVRKEKNKIIPTNKGWIVTGFLDQYCNKYIQDNFTASVEDQLDLIAEGKREWREFAKEFWRDFSGVISGIDAGSSTIIELIADKYAYHFFKERKCPKCETGQKMLRVLPKTEFLSCSNYPTCTWKDGQGNSEILLGADVEGGDEIFIKEGQHGPYLHWKNAAKNIALPEKLYKTITLEIAMELKKFPLLIGAHPETGSEISINIGKFGPYIKHEKTFVSCNLKEAIPLEQAIKMLAAKQAKKQFSSTKTPRSTSASNSTAAKPKTRPAKR